MYKIQSFYIKKGDEKDMAEAKLIARSLSKEYGVNFSLSRYIMLAIKEANERRKKRT